MNSPELTINPCHHFIAQSEFLVAFECGERAAFFNLWNRNVPQAMLERDPTCQNLEFTLSVYFAIYPIRTGVSVTPTHPTHTHHLPPHTLTHSLTHSHTHSHTQFLTHSLIHSLTQLLTHSHTQFLTHSLTLSHSLQSGDRVQSFQEFTVYLETRGAVLAQSQELAAYCALPYVPDPSKHPSFKKLFTVKEYYTWDQRNGIMGMGSWDHGNGIMGMGDGVPLYVLLNYSLLRSRGCLR